MHGSRILMSPLYREGTGVALALQIPITVICLLLLDFGRMAKICGIAMLAFWLVAGTIATRRRWSPTVGDLFYWRWGFVGCLVASVAIATVAGR